MLFCDQVVQAVADILVIREHPIEEFAPECRRNIRLSSLRKGA
jgi:hypothetical protein